MAGSKADSARAVAGGELWDQVPWCGEGAGRPERRDAAENRRRILAAARDLFAARGVDAVSMHEIARAAGIGQGTLYRRYAHKGDLCLALLDEGARRFHDDVSARVADEAAPALAVLDSLFARLVAFNEENATLLGALADAACGDRRGMVFRSPPYARLRDTVAALLDRAVARGELPPLDIAPAADALLAPFAIDLYLYQRHDRGFTAERIVATHRRLLLGGLRGCGEVGQEGEG